MRIPESVLEQLNSQADLVSMIRKHTTLKPAGREFKGCCPFHGEKTPSFFVNPQTNLYYCFGCGAKGNPFTFLKEFERMTFMEAAKTLSEQTGIELPKDDEFAKKIQYKRKSTKPTAPNSQLKSLSVNKTNTQPQPQTQSQPQSKPQEANTAPHSNNTPINSDLSNTYPVDTAFYDDDKTYDFGEYDVNAPAAFGDWQQNPADTTDESHGDLYSLLDNLKRYYQAMLNNHPAAKAYFLSRGLSEETITEFELGYAPSGWQHLEEAFPQDIDGLKMLGLVRQSQKGREFNLLRDRVIFPIKDRQGRTVGFAGRSLGDDLPKYINSPESPVFQKQHILYGLYEARQARAADFLMVEGYMDVIALHQAGIYGAVAPMGTAANERQIASLLKYNDTLTLCFDGDGAGQRAAWRTLEVAAPVLPDGKQLRFLTLPDNHDPDTYIKEHGRDAMRAQMTNAVSLSDYVFGVLTARFDLSQPEYKAAAMAHLKELTGKFPKGSTFKHWLNNEIYKKLSGRDRRFTSAADKANYKGQLNASVQLCLCILYAPSLLDDDPIHQILVQSGVVDVHAPFVERLEASELHLPALPTWQTLGDEMIAALVRTLDNLEKLKKMGVMSDFDTQANTAEAINGRAHTIMASLPNGALKSTLADEWQDFFVQMQTHSLENFSLLFKELLSQILQDSTKRQHEQSKNLLLSEIHKRRLQALIAWDNKHIKTQAAALLDR